MTQKGHAAAGRWTPDGWVVNLGADFEHSWWFKDEVARSGRDFFRETRARERSEEYLKVQRLRWISNALGEEAYNDQRSIPGGVWSVLGHHKEKDLAKMAGARPTAPDGNRTSGDSEKITEMDRKVKVGTDGLITIPAVSISKPESYTREIIAMKGFAEGTQLHCARDLRSDQSFEYTIEAPQDGIYELGATVVTVHPQQKLLVSANEDEEEVDFALPFRPGARERTEPVEVSLSRGRNFLRFTRPAPGHGLTIKEFTLKLRE